MDNQIEWQVYSAIYACQARIENGAEVNLAFTWLQNEIAQINNGEIIYDAE